MIKTVATLGMAAAALHQPNGIFAELHKEWEVPAFHRDSGAADDGSRASVDLLQFGDTRYPLRRPLTAVIRRQTASSYIEWFGEFGWSILGVGATHLAAAHSLVESFHVAFQRLVGLREFEMTGEEWSLWQQIESVVDVDGYLEITPIQLRELGRIVETRAVVSWRVEWFDGRKERVRVDQMPATMAGFKVGQWIDAIVARNRSTGRIERIVHAESIPPVQRIAGEELEEWIASLPKADLPVVESLWPRHVPEEAPGE